MAAISDQQRLSHFTTLIDSCNGSIKSHIHGSCLIENQLHSMFNLSSNVCFILFHAKVKTASISQTPVSSSVPHIALMVVLFHVRWARPCPNIPQANFSRSSDVDNRGELAACDLLCQRRIWYPLQTKHRQRYWPGGLADCDRVETAMALYFKI